MNKSKKSKKIYIVDAIIAIVLLVIDQYTKYLTIDRLKGNPAYVLIDGVLELQYLENRGSAFGILQNQKAFILFIGVIFMAVIVYVLMKLPAQKKFYVAQFNQKNYGKHQADGINMVLNLCVLKIDYFVCVDQLSDF